VSGKIRMRALAEGRRGDPSGGGEAYACVMGYGFGDEWVEEEGEFLRCWWHCGQMRMFSANRGKRDSNSGCAIDLREVLPVSEIVLWCCNSFRLKA
jgi:hypothetical protein